MSTPIDRRKSDHLSLCASEEVGFRRTTTLFENVRLVHNALPDLDAAVVDLSVTLLGKQLRAPILIASMTGGTDEAGRVNRELASIAEERGYAFGLGSQRAMHKRKETNVSYRVRDVARHALIFGNLGIVQARELPTSEIRALLDDVKADALFIHLNPAMELIQKEGDRDFSRGRETIARLVSELSLPIVIKETGSGIAPHVGRLLKATGIRHVDVSGAGGTSWVGVETKRAERKGDVAGRALGEALWDWGIPTAASVATLAPLGFETLIATGGIATGMDVAKALALGAHAAGIARPVLKAFYDGGRAGALAFLDGVEAELRAVMLLTGSRLVGELRRAPRVIVGELSAWIEQLGCDSNQLVAQTRASGPAWGGDPEKRRFFGAGRRVPPRKG